MKKGSLPLEFLVVIILTAIIFVPSCYIVSKLIGDFSSQARDSFFAFSEKLEKIGSSPDGNIDTASLFLDDKTALVYFEPGENEVEIDVSAPAGYVPYVIHLERPITKECLEEEACLCLFYNAEVDYDSKGLGTFTVQIKKPLCAAANELVQFRSCGFGTAVNVKSYTCKQGFLVEKNFVKEIISSSPKKSYFESDKQKISVILKKEGDNVILEA